MSPVLDYDGMHTSCRVENIDGDNNWDTADTNGNGQLDPEESYSPQVDFDEIRSETAGVERVTILGRTERRVFIQTLPDTGSGISGTEFSNSGFSDDIDRDGQYGTSGFQDSIEIPPGNSFPDFDDLVLLPTSFTSTGYRNHSAYRGFSVARVFRYTMPANSINEDISPNGTLDETDPHSLKDSIEISLGGRFSRLEDRNSTDLGGQILGLWNVNSLVDQTTVGPEIGVAWRAKRFNWLLRSTGSVLLGYKVEDVGQVGAIGHNLTTGQRNHPLYFESTKIDNNVHSNNLVPQANVDLSASYDLSNSATFSVGYAAFYLEDVRYAQQLIDWTLPSMGIKDVHGDSVLRGTLYASLDLRR